MLDFFTKKKAIFFEIKVYFIIELYLIYLYINDKFS